MSSKNIDNKTLNNNDEPMLIMCNPESTISLENIENLLKNKPRNINEDPMLIMSNLMETKNSTNSSSSESNDDSIPNEVKGLKSKRSKRKRPAEEQRPGYSPDRKRYRKWKLSMFKSSSNFESSESSQASQYNDSDEYSEQDQMKMESKKSEHRCRSCGAMCL